MSDRYDLGPVEFIQKIDGEYGLNLDEDSAGWLMWNRTGWPAFWPRELGTPAEAFEFQVRAELRCLADFGSFSPDPDWAGETPWLS